MTNLITDPATGLQYDMDERPATHFTFLAVYGGMLKLSVWDDYAAMTDFVRQVTAQMEGFPIAELFKYDATPGGWRCGASSEVRSEINQMMFRIGGHRVNDASIDGVYDATTGEQTEIDEEAMAKMRAALNERRN